MEFTAWLAFVGVALFVCFTPGPAVLLAISNSLGFGARRAMISSLGNALGLLMLSAAATAGLGAVLQASATAFLVLKIVGATYLIWLGVRQWMSRATSFAAPPPADPRAAAKAGWRLFGHGLSVALTNPKSILFFTALYPQFLQSSAPAAEQFVVLTGTFAACAVLSHVCYVLLARTLQARLASPRRVRAMNRVFGASFVALGVSLLGWRSKAA